MIRFLGLVLWALAAALLIAIFAGEDLTISLRLWLVAFVCWFGGSLLLGLLSRVAIVPSRARLLLARATDNKTDSAGSLHTFRSLESLLLRSRENERTYRQQFRPRLTELADHFLLVHHGINRTTHPDRAAALLGDVAWMIQEDESAPSPTFDEFDRFLDRILPSTQGGNT